MAKRKTQNKKQFEKIISAWIPEYLYNILEQRAKENNIGMSASLRNMICDGINYRLIMEDESKDN